MADLRRVFPATSKRREYSAYSLEVCVFHPDKNPSLLIYSDHYTCKACGAFGRSYNGVQGDASAAPVEVQNTQDEQPIPFEYALLYHTGLGDRQRAYFRGRGLSDDTIDRFLLGYGTAPDAKHPRYTVPLIEDGKLWGVKFRRDDLVEPASAVKYYGFKEHNRPRLWGASGVALNPRVLVVAGELDRIIAVQELAPDLYPVTGTGGEGAISQAWVDHLKLAEKVYVCMDSDVPGRRAQAKLIRMLRANGLCPVPVYLPTTHKDVTDFLMDRGKDAFMRVMPDHKVIWFMNL